MSFLHEKSNEDKIKEENYLKYKKHRPRVIGNSDKTNLNHLNNLTENR